MKIPKYPLENVTAHVLGCMSPAISTPYASSFHKRAVPLCTWHVACSPRRCKIIGTFPCQQMCATILNSYVTFILHTCPD